MSFDLPKRFVELLLVRWSVSIDLKVGNVVPEAQFVPASWKLVFCRVCVLDGSISEFVKCHFFIEGRHGV